MHINYVFISFADMHLSELGGACLRAELEDNQYRQLRLLLRLSICEGVRTMFTKYSSNKWTQVSFLVNLVLIDNIVPRHAFREKYFDGYMNKMHDMRRLKFTKSTILWYKLSCTVRSCRYIYHVSCRCNPQPDLSRPNWNQTTVSRRHH